MPHPPLTPLVTPDNHGPTITIAAAFCMSNMLLFALVRICIRYPFSTLFSRDDWLAISASAIATVQASLTLGAVTEGLGKKMFLLSAGRADTVLKMEYAGTLLYVVALCLAKLSIIYLVKRLSCSDKHWLASHVLAYSTIAWGVGSLLVVALRQNLTHPWMAESTLAESNYIRWAVVESLGLLLEVGILAFVLWLLLPLQMKRQNKAAVISGFLMRIPIIAIVPLRLYYLHQAVMGGSNDPTFALTIPVILEQVEMHFTVLSATIPCLRIFLKSFHSGYLGGVGLTTQNPSTARSRTR